jgi:arylsulfatase A-like enzyme/Flp pilus assembly protein TadD
MRKLAALVLLLTVWGCARGERRTVTSDGPIIIISIDTLRSDHLPAYGYKAIETPAIDALRADAILFERAYSHCPLTLPSHATLLTGRLPEETGVHDNAGFHLDAKVETLAEHLKKRGYATGAAVSAYPMRGSTGLSRGFDFYDDKFVESAGDRTMTDIQRGGEETTRIAQNWIQSQRGSKFFFLLHLYEPHSPYTPPAAYQTYASPYDGEVAYSDSIVGSFIDFLKQRGMYDSATIVLLSDHGEGLGDHGEDEHGILLYRESLQVPLLVKLPNGDRRGTSVSTPAQLIDVFPTLAALSGDSAKSNGTSLLTLNEQTEARPIFAETHFPSLHLGWSDLHSVISDLPAGSRRSGGLEARAPLSMHLIRGVRSELFDVVADPAEAHEISNEHRRERAALDALLAPRVVPIRASEPISPEEAKKLAALGYIGSAAPGAGNSSLDPRDEIHAYREVRNAMKFFEERRYDEATAAAHALLAHYPHMIDLWEVEADSLGNLGRAAEGAAAAKRGLALNPSASGRLAIRIADLSARAGNMKDAREHAELAMRTMPAEAHAVLARVAMTERSFDRAAAEANLAIKADPNRPLPYSLIGHIALARNDRRGALLAFDRAAEVAARSGRPLRNLQTTRGVVLMQLGRDADAEAAFRQELQAFPQDPGAWRNVLVFLVEHKRAAEAQQLASSLLQSNDSPMAYAVIAESFASSGDRDAARAIARAGLERYPGHPELTRYAR